MTWVGFVCPAVSCLWMRKPPIVARAATAGAITNPATAPARPATSPPITIVASRETAYQACATAWRVCWCVPANHASGSDCAAYVSAAAEPISSGTTSRSSSRTAAMK